MENTNKSERELFLILFNSFHLGKTGIGTGEKLVFSLVVALMGESGTVTQFDIINANKANKKTTYTIIARLIKGGYLSASRSPQYFSKSYLSLTEKGLLLKAHIRKTLLQGLK